jgi:DNA-binding NarL/FixJ family response regulator
MNEQRRVLLAQAWPMLRSALSLLLEQQPELQVVGEAADGPAALASLHELRPDLVLFDWDLPERGGADLLNALRQAAPDTILLAMSSRPEIRSLALAAGANGFISKADPPERLLATIADSGRR